MNNTAEQIAALNASILAKRVKIAHAETLVENAAHRFEVLGSDTYIENGKTHFYPKGKAALTRLRKRREALSRLKQSIALDEARLSKITSAL